LLEVVVVLSMSGFGRILRFCASSTKERSTNVC
jgi:hypothetical protein